MLKRDVIQNLKDAGCDSSTIDVFFKLGDVKSQECVLKLLSKHKAALLKDLHDNQRKIDCLDHLIFDIKQNGLKNYE